jgi:hypothetical protein
VNDALANDVELERLAGVRPRLAYNDIVRHPRLREAIRVYLDAFLAVYDDEPFLVRLLIEAGRIALAQFVMVLGAGYEPARRETWPTVSRLKETMAAMGLASGRHVDQLVGRLCDAGFLVLAPAEHDRRIKVIAGTEKLWAHDRDWVAAHVAPLAVCYPQHDYGLALRRDPDFHVRMKRVSTRFFPVIGRLVRAVPDMNLFFDRAGGYMVLAALLQTALVAEDGLRAAVPYAHAGERFGLSRTHVRRLLGAAEDAGLVKLPARGGHQVEILPRLWASHDRGISCGMYLHDLVYVETMKTYATEQVAHAGQSAEPDRVPERIGELRRVKQRRNPGTGR